jgi:hypothetical protein
MAKDYDDNYYYNNNNKNNNDNNNNTLLTQRSRVHLHEVTVAKQV